MVSVNELHTLQVAVNTQAKNINIIILQQHIGTRTSHLTPQRKVSACSIGAHNAAWEQTCTAIKDSVLNVCLLQIKIRRPNICKHQIKIDTTTEWSHLTLNCIITRSKL